LLHLLKGVFNIDDILQGDEDKYATLNKETQPREGERINLRVSAGEIGRGKIHIIL